MFLCWPKEQHILWLPSRALASLPSSHSPSLQPNFLLPVTWIYQAFSCLQALYLLFPLPRMPFPPNVLMTPLSFLKYLFKGHCVSHLPTCCPVPSFLQGYAARGLTFPPPPPPLTHHGLCLPGSLVRGLQLGSTFEKHERNWDRWKGQDFILLSVCLRQCLSNRCLSSLAPGCTG